jgi:hypothetical protein
VNWFAITFLVLALCPSRALFGAEGEIVISHDGSIAVPLILENADSSQVAVLSFGLPHGQPAKCWCEGQLLRQLWVTNGIQYTQSVFLAALPVPGITNPVPLLVVEVRGVNTNSEYAEAFAGVRLQSKRQSDELELKEGLVWRKIGEKQLVLGVLEVPGPGIKVSKGTELRFSGNMPPAERGSLCLAVPLQVVVKPQEIELLRDFDFQAEIRKAAKSTSPSSSRLKFSGQ